MGNRGTLTDGEGMIFGLSYKIDIVFCIDVTKEMDNVLEKLPTFLSLVPEFINQELLKMDRVTNQIRMRVIAFSDSQENAQIINASHFYTVLPATNSSALTAFVSGLRIMGEGDTPNSALEALDEAMKSNWVQVAANGERLRHVIVLLTDGSINTVSEYSRELAELEKRWGTTTGYDEHTVMHQFRKRLLLVAPDMKPWSIIGDNWMQCTWLPTEAGSGLAELMEIHPNETSQIVHVFK